MLLLRNALVNVSRGNLRDYEANLQLVQVITHRQLHVRFVSFLRRWRYSYRSTECVP